MGRQDSQLSVFLPSETPPWSSQVLRQRLGLRKRGQRKSIYSIVQDDKCCEDNKKTTSYITESQDPKKVSKIVCLNINVALCICVYYQYKYYYYSPQIIYNCKCTTSARSVGFISSNASTLMSMHLWCISWRHIIVPVIYVCDLHGLRFYSTAAQLILITKISGHH